jgi:hypothetical protein
MAGICQSFSRQLSFSVSSLQTSNIKTNHFSFFEKWVKKAVFGEAWAGNNHCFSKGFLFG